MKASNVEFLEANRGIYTTLKNAGFIINLTGEVREGLLRIAREEFNPGYLCCLHCSADVAAMVTYVYTQFDARAKEEAKLFVEEVPKPVKKKVKNEKPR